MDSRRLCSLIPEQNLTLYGLRKCLIKNDDFDEAEYRAYREELAAYDDFVASLDMGD